MIRRHPDIKHLRRPEIGWPEIVQLQPTLREVPTSVADQVVSDVKYEGYITRQQVDVDRQRRLAHKRIPLNFDYHKITQLRAEARERLIEMRPTSLAQASRISGITPADVALLMVHLEGNGKHRSKQKSRST